MAFTFLSENGFPYLWILLALGVLIYYASRGIYRLWFHPLAEFPGPKVAALTYWYEGYYELIQNGGNQCAPEVGGVRAKYGPIIRINPDGIYEAILFCLCTG